MAAIPRTFFLVYALAGFVGLGYQVAWFRIFADRFGSTSFTFAVVVASFIGGLGAGSFGSRPLAERLRRWARLDDTLRLYGLIELLVAACGALTLVALRLPPDLLGHFPYALVNGVYEPTFASDLVRSIVAALVVFLPCFFMGATFPLLCAGFRADDRLPALLYAWNTLGACGAVLAAEFVLLPWLGHERAFLAMLALNGAIGVVLVVRPPAAARAIAPRASALNAPAERATESAAARPPAAPHAVLLFGAVASGLLTGAIEGDVFKRMQLFGCVYGGSLSFISFWAILAIFLASVTARMWKGLSLEVIAIAFLAAAILHGATLVLADDIQRAVEAPDIARQIAALESRGAPPDEFVHHPFQYGPRSQLVFTGLFTFPPFYLLTLFLPWAANAWHGAGRHLGLAWGLNTIAFCAGLIGFTWLAPLVNVFYSTKVALMLLVATAVVFAAITLLARRGRATGRAVVERASIGAAAFAAACVFMPADFDPRYFPDGHPARTEPIRVLPGGRRAVSDGAHTLYIVERAQPWGPQLFFENYPMSGTGAPAQRYMRLMAHLPLLAQESPERALLICFGVGNTASAIAAHASITEIDTVDLSRRVFELAGEFAATNGEVHLDPRLRMILDDGRRFLRSTDRRYDLITCEPPPPLREGVYRLYTREFYADVRDHLSAGGMMTQWLPLWQMGREAVEASIATFLDVFPHAMLCVGHGDEYILLGSVAEIDLRRIEASFGDDPNVARDLDHIDLPEPLAIFLTIVMGDRSLRALYGGSRILSDQHNDFALASIDPFDPAMIPYDPERVLAEIGADRLASGEALRETMTSPEWISLLTRRTSLAAPSERSERGVRENEAP